MPVPDFSPGEVLTAAAMDSIGLWKVGEFTASGTSRALVCDNVFTSNYRNYRVVLNLRSTANANVLFMQMLNTAGAVINTGYQSTAYGQDYAGAGTSFSVNGDAGDTYASVGWIPNSTINNIYASFDVFCPMISSEATAAAGVHAGLASGVSWLGGAMFMQRTVAEQNRGLRFDNSSAANLTGVVRIYGYRD